MFTLVSMVRGINVGGNRPIKMERLRGIHADLGYRSVRTYLQSGNAVFEARSPDTAGHSAALERRIRRDCGFEVAVAVRTSGEMAAILAANPFAGRPSVDPRFLHATFLVHSPGNASLGDAAIPFARGEAAVLVGDVVYLYCPLGYGVTRINNAFFEGRLAASATTRNWRTVTALEKMARGELP